MSLYETPQPEPETPTEPEQPEYDDAACMSECQRLMDLIGHDFGLAITYAESRVNLADLAPAMQMRAVVRLLRVMGVTEAMWTQAVHEELRDTLRQLLVSLEAKRDEAKKPQLALPGGKPGLVLPNGRPIKH